MEERTDAVPLSSKAAKDAKTRLAKIIGQLKTIAKMLEDSPRDIEALTQYASANAAVGSLMRLVAKDAILTQIEREIRDGSTEQYIYSLLSLLNDIEDYEVEDYDEYIDYDINYSNGDILKHCFYNIGIIELLINIAVFIGVFIYGINQEDHTLKSIIIQSIIIIANFGSIFKNLFGDYIKYYNFKSLRKNDKIYLQITDRTLFFDKKKQPIDHTQGIEQLKKNTQIRCILTFNSVCDYKTGCSYKVNVDQVQILDRGYTTECEFDNDDDNASFNTVESASSDEWND